MTRLLKPKVSQKHSFSRITFFKKSGARLYLPEKVVSDAAFPFKDGDVLKIEFADGALKLRSVEWWELLDWETMPEAFRKLPKEIQMKIAAQT
ncbi:MAG: hypothetical protein ACE14S_03885 [Candidatus Bathyarchaeia archaeon]